MGISMSMQCGNLAQWLTNFKLFSLSFFIVSSLMSMRSGMHFTHDVRDDWCYQVSASLELIWWWRKSVMTFLFLVLLSDRFFDRLFVVFPFYVYVFYRTCFHMTMVVLLISLWPSKQSPTSPHIGLGLVQCLRWSHQSATDLTSTQHVETIGRNRYWMIFFFFLLI